MKRQSKYLEGALAMAPVLIGIIPMAIVTGVSAVNSGMTQGQALISSMLMYAAAAQLVAYEMIGNGASAYLIFLAAIILNLRLVLYSAGIATHLQSEKPLIRLLGAYTLTDQAFGVTIVHYQKNKRKSLTKFYLGAALLMWLVYQFSAFIGIILGKTIPAGFSLDFAIPLTFSALVLPLLTNFELRVSAITSAGIAILFANIPNNGGFFAATFFGILIGSLIKFHKRKKTDAAK